MYDIIVHCLQKKTKLKIVKTNIWSVIKGPSGGKNFFYWITFLKTSNYEAIR